MNTRARSPTIRVLHVTDEQDSVEVVTGALERADDRIEVVTARSVDEGLGRLAGDPIDCVVSDYDLPGRNGLEFLEAVRETHGDLPFVLYTDDGSEGVASEAVSAGVTEYLPKRSVTENPGRLAGRCLDAARGYRDRRQAVERRCLLGVVRDVGRVLLRADTCEELDQGVCDVIADADPYCFVWIGDREPGSRRITPRARPTGGGGLADELSAAMEDEADWNPAVEALDAREIRVVHDAEDSPCGPWRELALERGFRSSAAVPLVHESEDHGVLNVYAARPGAFDGSGRSILIDLGADIAHARHALRIRGDLKRTAGRLEALFENSPNMIDIHDADGTILEANPRMCEKLGYSEDELRGMRVWEIDRTIDPERAVSVWATMEPGDRYELEGSYRRRDGSTFPVEVHLQRLGEEEDERFVVISRDISERKRQERKRERILDRVTDAIIEVDEDWRFTTVDDRAEELVGMTEEDLLGESVWEVFSEAVGTQFEEKYRRVMETREPTSFEAYYRGFDGWFTVQAYPDEGGGMSCYFQEVTERKERERELEQYEAIVENTEDGIYVFDTDGRFEFVNRRVVDVSGIGRDAWVDEHVSILADLGTLSEREVGAVEEGIEAIGHGCTDEVSIELTPDVQTDLRVLELRLTAFPAEEGPDRIIGFSRDVTERKRHERELERKNERLEEFVRVVSHDLRNPLNVAEGMLELAREDFDNDRLDDVERAHGRMRVLIDDLLRYAREGETAMDVQPIALAGTVEGCWENVGTSGATLVVDTERTVHADASRLRQLLENLIRNAVDHGGTNVTVTVGDLDDGFYVADDGPGIPPEKQDAVFEVGYSTNREGTGFGLAIAREVADAQGWEIDVTASEAGGARFELTGVDTS